MSKLYTFGCSLTYGDHMPDCRDWWPKKSRYMTGIKPSKFAWPEVTAKLMGKECVNLGDSGASNKKIWYNIVNTKFDKDAVVIIMWSHIDRYCILDEEKYNMIGAWLDTNPSYAFFKHFHQEYDMILDLYQRINYAKLFLDSKGIKNYHLLQRQSLSQYNFKWSTTNFLSVFMQVYRNQYPFALDNSHPGIEAHDAVGKAIYDAIINERYVY